MKENLQSYQDVLRYLGSKNRKKHLLLGNGFSMSYDSGIFSYNALSRFMNKIDDPIIRELFTIINTSNFELIMQQLDNFKKIAEIFGVNKEAVKKIGQASENLKSGLIDAIKELHPEHVFKVSENKSRACANFLNAYLHEDGHVFTANYDLLLYWILMRNSVENSIDGFGRDAEETTGYVPEEEREYSELRWGKYKEEQSIHYLHGALPLFDNGIEIIKEEYTSEHYLLENIKQRLAKKEYPIFVTAGSWQQKLRHIMHNKYLSYCYETLSSINGSLITFGFNFGEYDDHIIRAINRATKFNPDTKSKLLSIYIAVYSDTDYEHILAIKHKFKCKVNLFDAKSVRAWG